MLVLQLGFKLTLLLDKVVDGVLALSDFFLLLLALFSELLLGLFLGSEVYLQLLLGLLHELVPFLEVVQLFL